MRAPAVAMVTAAPLGSGLSTMRIWQLRSAEPRFGGISALAWNDGELLGITDSGVSIRWPAPGGQARFADLPGGPGPPQWKIHRDSEAILRDPFGRGWWVAFEQFHSLYLFDPALRRPLGQRTLKLRTWWRNWGVEAAVALPGGRLLLLPENGGEAIIWSAEGERRSPLKAPAQISDAVRLADGRVVVALRRVRPWGMANSLGWLKHEAGGYRVEPWRSLPLGRWDNVEGLAAEPLAGGGTRLWFVTDNDYRRRTFLGSILVDVERSSPGHLGEVPRRGGGG